MITKTGSRLSDIISKAKKTGKNLGYKVKSKLNIRQPKTRKMTPEELEELAKGLSKANWDDAPRVKIFDD